MTDAINDTRNAFLRFGFHRIRLIDATANAYPGHRSPETGNRTPVTAPMLVVIATAAAFLLSSLGVAIIRRWAERRGVLDVPNERSSHRQPTPSGGGLAIVVVTLGGWWCFVLLDPTVSRTATLTYTVGVALIAGTSWFDDVVHPLPNRLRFAMHSVGAILAIWGFGYWHTVNLPLFGQVHLGGLGLAITFLWLVGLTNAYNFMDGIDGIAGGQAVVAGLAWAVFGSMNGHELAGLLGLLLAASSLGFLLHNWPPARIFMGDVGSTFLGYTLAVLPLMNQ